MTKKACLAAALVCFALAGVVALAQAPTPTPAVSAHTHPGNGPDWKWVAIFVITGITVPGLGFGAVVFYRQVQDLGTKLDKQSTSWAGKIDELKKVIQESVLQTTRLEERLEAVRADIRETREIAVCSNQKATRLHARLDVLADRIERCPSCPNVGPELRQNDRRASDG